MLQRNEQSETVVLYKEVSPTHISGKASSTDLHQLLAVVNTHGKEAFSPD